MAFAARGTGFLVALLLVVTPGAPRAEVLATSAPELPHGASWSVLELSGSAWPAFPQGFEGRIFWDLRPAAGSGLAVTWSVLDPDDAGLRSIAARHGADSALCAVDPAVGRRLGCRLFHAAGSGPAGPRWLWSDRAGDVAGATVLGSGAARGAALSVGAAWVEEIEHADGGRTVIAGRAVAEGIVLVPAGPQEVVLLRETIERGADLHLRYRFLTSGGMTAAALEGPVPGAGARFRPDVGEVLLSAGSAAVDDGIQIAYTDLSQSLSAGAVAFLQRSVVKQCSVSRTTCQEDVECPTGESCGTPLSSLNASWSTVQDMIGIDQASSTYQPDPGDPGSTQNLGETWDFTGLSSSTLDYRAMYTVRDDLAGADCPEVCSIRDQSANPPDGTWQAYLKIDTYDPSDVQFTRDVFMLNDNDTGANPAIDLPFIAQDELNTGDRTQICSQDSGGGADRLIHYFRFFGPDPASAVMQRGDTWLSGAWTRCNNGDGLHLTLASQCGSVCYPDCSGTSPRGRGMRNASGAGIESTIVEDGWVRTPTGNYVPALLMRQITDIEAGRELFGVCNLAPQRSYSIDYFWLHPHYGILATVSSPTDETATMPPDDWSLLGNLTDGADFSWGPFPPHETEALACLSGTRVRWALPLDGSNPSADPGVSSYGYVVSWGNLADPEDLADPGLNPNHSPLPGEPGYLSAPAGAEPTSYVIDTWAGAAINVTVTTSIDYTDPDVLDTTSYRSAAFYKVMEDPARLSAATFVVGDAVAPFVTKSGSDLTLDWPAVAGAESYLVKVFDLDTDLEIPCPGGMNCTPSAPTTTHPGAGADAGNYGYRAFAVDPCGEVSAN